MFDNGYWTYVFENGPSIEGQNFIQEEELQGLIKDFGKVVVNFKKGDLTSDYLESREE